MPRISKVEQQARAEKAVRAEKAKASILETLAKLLDKHVTNLIRTGVETEAAVSLKINGEGKASMSLTYQTIVRDGAAFVLDDGQEDLPLGDKGEPGQSTDHPDPRRNLVATPSRE